jgi:hypothetical protein
MVKIEPFIFGTLRTDLCNALDGILLNEDEIIDPITEKRKKEIENIIFSAMQKIDQAFPQTRRFGTFVYSEQIGKKLAQIVWNKQSSENVNHAMACFGTWEKWADWWEENVLDEKMSHEEIKSLIAEAWKSENKSKQSNQDAGTP